MARRTKVVVVCDRHRNEVEAVGTVEFTIDGERRSLDLCAEHLAEIRRTMRPWLRQRAAAPAARASSAKSTSKRAPAAKKGGRRVVRNTDGPAIRAWAATHGYDLPERGRIPAAVREAYAASK